MIKKILIFNLMFANLFVSAQKITTFTGEYKEESNTYVKLSHQLIGTSEKEIKEFLKQNFDILNKENMGLKLETDKTSQGGKHLRFLQTWKNIKVYDASIKINISNQNKVLNVLNSLRDFNTIPTNSQVIDPEATMNSLKSQFDGESRFSINYEPVLFLQNNQPYYAFRYVTYNDRIAGAHEILINAETGEEFMRRKLSSDFMTDTTGKGTVFIPDPVTKTNSAAQTCPICDNNDADNTTLTGLRDTVKLKNIDFRNNKFYLEGPYVKISEVESPTIAPVTSNDGNFFFTRSQSGFEDVSVYYHIDSLQRYIHTLGFTNLFLPQLEADSHGLNGSDNSHFVPGSQPYLAFGEGGVDDAEDADVVTHEYGHSISEAGSPSTNGGNQRSGLDEGFGDYIAATYSKSMNANRWSDIFNWDGHSSNWDGRICNSTITYTLVNGSNFYNYGTLWCTVMMNVQLVIGKTPSDKIFFQELFMNNNNMTVPDAANQVLDADTMLYGGQFSPNYIGEFCRMKILSGQICSLAASIPSELEVNAKLFPNPATQKINIEFENWSQGETWVTVSDLLGREVSKFKINQFLTEINTSNWNKGVYLVSFNQDFKSFSKKIVIE